MDIYHIIDKKKNGQALSVDEIDFFIKGVVGGAVCQAQIGAFLMAVVLKGMSASETLQLTLSMAASGEMLDLSKYEYSVDKHSSGGVGDSTSFIVAPIVAACGCVCAKMSGRGLGYTGGTLDKLESIKGLSVSKTSDDFYKQLDDIGIAIIGQTKNICPADKILYSIRDITATIDSIPLITASIMSKKLAGGAKHIVLDVKCGRGAFMHNIDEARALAKSMVEIGRLADRKVTAVITNMDLPLSNYIGNALEVYGALEVLQGKKNNLYEVSRVLSEELLRLTGIKDCAAKAITALDSGQAYTRFCAMINAQGGDTAVLVREKLVTALFSYDIFVDNEGYISDIDSKKIAEVVSFLGGGRTKLEDSIDYTVGVFIAQNVGDKHNADRPIATMYYSDYNHLVLCKDIVEAFSFTADQPKKTQLILDIIR